MKKQRERALDNDDVCMFFIGPKNVTVSDILCNVASFDHVESYIFGHERYTQRLFVLGGIAYRTAINLARFAILLCVLSIPRSEPTNRPDRRS